MIAVLTFVIVILVFAGILCLVYRETEVDFPCKRKRRRTPNPAGDGSKPLPPES